MGGAVVVTCAMSDLRKDGVVVSLSDGILPLLGAELCRYTIAHIADSMAQDGADDTARANWTSNRSEADDLEEGAGQCAVSETISTVSNDLSIAAASMTADSAVQCAVPEAISTVSSGLAATAVSTTIN